MKIRALLVIFGLFLSGLTFAKSEFVGDWELYNQEDGMTSKCIKHKTGYLFCKIEKIMNFTLHELVAINTDPGFLSEWMETVMYSKQVEKVDDKNYVNYVQYDIPLPFRDRHSATRTIITQESDTKKVRMKFETEHAYKLDNLKFEPMKNIQGQWVFTPVTKEKTKVEYGVLVIAGGALVPFLFNTRAEEVPWVTVKNMEKELASNRYEGVKINFIENN